MATSTTTARAPRSAKTPARTTKTRAQTAAKPKTARVSRSRKPKTPTPEERTVLIEQAAYLRAERRGFQNGSPEQDWLEAEQEIDRILGRG